MEQQLLCDDIFYEAMLRMDAETLAIAGCVSTSFRSASTEETLWENLCSSRWPSITTDRSKTRHLISKLGGFQKFYSECSSLIDVDVDPSKISAQESISLTNAHHTNFASLVDVQFKGKPLFSKFISGIPSAGDFSDWFSSCPFRLDVIEGWWQNIDDDHSQVKSPDSTVSCEMTMLQGKVWNEILEGVTVSWIVIDVENNHVANISSRRPVSGQRHWPTDGEFVLNYGSIINTSMSGPVECSIILKCGGTAGEVPVKVNELSLQLKKAVGGEHLNGRDALPVLCRAAAAAKCRDEGRMMSIYRDFLKAQSGSKIDEQRHELLSDLRFLVLVVIAVLTSLVLV